MNLIRLGRSDLHVTPICLGTMTFGEQVGAAQAHDILDRSLERLDRSIADLRTDVDRKFNWIIGVQVGSLLAMIGFMAKLARFF